VAAYDFDLFVIGAGSAGVAAARRSAEYGARVAICEEDRAGGTCVNRGCIPKKLYAYASHFREEFEDATAYGWSPSTPGFDWPSLVRAKQREIGRLNDVYLKLLREAGVTFVPGRARLETAHAVRVGSELHTAETLVIATGGWPWLPEVPGIEHAITSNEAFDLERLPERIVIVGGGYIAVEFAGIFNGLGVDTRLLYRRELFLRGFDDDVRRTLAEELQKKGIELRFRTRVDRIDRRDGRLAVTTAAGDVLEADQVLYATGRTPNTRGLGLEQLGVELRPNGAVVVDRSSRSSVPGIYALGDCTDRLKLTPMAIREGRCLAETLYNRNPLDPEHRDVPSAVFSQPPIGTVGLTEAEARASLGEIDVYRTRFRPLKHTLTGRDETTMMKLVVERGSDRVVGCHMVGADAPEVIQGLGIALKCRATKAQFDATVGIHPTAAEEFVTLRLPIEAK
jgi:glutathione reductase (NADPH)